MTLASAPHGLRLSAEARGMLPWCIALAASAHVLLLVAMAPAGPRLGGLAGQAAGHAGRPIGVRLLAAESMPRNRTAVLVPAITASGVQPVPLVAADAASAASAPASASEPAASAFAAAPAQDADAAATAATSIPGDAIDGGYVPRPLLSVVPDAIDPVVIATTPEVADIPGRHAGVLSLYIDEQGRVRRIEADEPALPAAMERAAREAFMAARFSPGQVDGHVVRSRLRIEVVFDDDSEPMRMPTAAASAASTASAPRAASGANAARAASGQRSP
jgi:hypothetical protein